MSDAGRLLNMLILLTGVAVPAALLWLPIIAGWIWGNPTEAEILDWCDPID
jgi:hypothetical protein